MKVLPEKVEAKIFLLILIICLSMSLLGVRLMVMSQESLLLSAHTQNLSRVADHHVQRSRDAFARYENQAVIANELVRTAILDVEDEATLDFSLAKRAAAKVTVDRVAPMLRETFASYYVAVENDFLLTAFGSNPDRTSRIEETNLGEKYSISGPVENPLQLPIWTSPQHNPAKNAWVTTLLVPLYNDDSYLGFTASELVLTHLFEDVLELAEAEALGGAFLINEKGLIVTPHGNSTGTDEINASRTIPAELVQWIVRRYAEFSPEEKRSRSISYSEGENRNTAYIAPLGVIDWKLLVAHDAELIEAQIAGLTWKLALAAGALALTLVLLIRASFRQLFTHRIIGLERSARAFTRRGIVDFDDAGNDEIGSLSNAFREMVESLANREAELTIRNRQLQNEISGRLSAVESLRESELKLRTLFDKSSDAVLIFDGKALIDCNEAAVQMLKCASKEALLKRRLPDLTPEFQPEGVSSSSFSENMLEQAVANGNFRYEWVVRAADATEFWVEAVVTLVPYGDHDVFYMVWRDATVRKEKEQERIQLSMAIEQAAETIIVTDPAGIMLYVNPSFENLTGCPRAEALGSVSAVLATQSESDGDISIWPTLERGEVWKGRIANTRKDETIYQAETTVSPVRDASGTVTNYVIVSYDVTKMAALETQLLQAQKMEAIGELASGIAHEINTPTQYIGDNIRFLQESFGDIRTLLEKFLKLLSLVKSGEQADTTVSTIESFATEIELDYLVKEIPIAVEQSLEGNSRIAEIVRAMKEFAHPGLEEKTAVDINHAIENTIAVARNEWKYVAEIVTDFDETLPDVPCLPGAFNQVILNIIVNAAHAVGETVKDKIGDKGTITIRTGVVEGCLEVRIQDTGPGIPEKLRLKIFDPFFTTKDAGKGTGQGLALVHSVIVDKHEGTIDFETELGKGTTFVIRLPLAHCAVSSDELELAGMKVGD